MEKKHHSANLGLIMLTALVTGNMVGSGIFTLPASLASFGSLSLVAWVVTALGAMLLAYVFAQWSQVLPKTGGPYAYCHAAFGDLVGFEVAYSYWIAVWVGNAAVAVALISYLAVFFPSIETDPQVGLAAKLAAVWLLTAINVKGVKEAAIFQLVATIMKVIPLALIGLIGVFYINPEHFQQFNLSDKSNLGAINACATLTFWAFIGLESATVPAEDAKNKSAIAYATLIGTAITAVIYIICSIAVMGLVPSSILAGSSAPFTDAIQVLFPGYSQIAGQLIAVCAIITCLGTLNGWVLLQGQIPKAAAEDRLFPKFFTKENSHGAPYWGVIISSILVSLLLLMTMNAKLIEQFNFIISIALFFSLLPYSLSAIGVLFYLKPFRQQFGSRQLKFIILSAVLGAAFGIWAIAGIGIEILPFSCLVLLSGLPFYYFFIRSSKHQ